MKRILRRQNSGYALALILCLIGIAAILVPLWKTWPQVSSSQDPVSTFWTLLWTQNLDFIPGIQFQLAYLTILGIVSIAVGVVVLILSRQWFFLPGETVLLQCPFCKKTWTSIRNKALVHCPYCRQLVHPTMAER
jgi:uncharacterized protein YjeT (DUF2065 family)